MDGLQLSHSGPSRASPETSEQVSEHAVVMSEHLCQVRMDALAFSGAALVVWQLVQKVVKAQLEFFERSFDLLWFPLACNLGSGQ